MTYTHKQFLLYISDWLMMKGWMIGVKYRSDEELEKFIEFVETVANEARYDSKR